MSCVINLYGGPGSGKSTNATGLFSLMKRQYFNVEYVSEYAKDLTWEDRHNVLLEQDWILANQNKRLRRLIGKVDFIVTDSPVLMSTVYVPDDFYISCLKQHILDVHHSYNNINFYLGRVKKYVPIGRTQTESQAKVVDNKIKTMLIENGIEFVDIVADDNAPENMLKYIREAMDLDLK